MIVVLAFNHTKYEYMKHSQTSDKPINQTMNTSNKDQPITQAITQALTQTIEQRINYAIKQAND